ncbi:TonB-dependent receptor domain-containing protein [Bacteroidota bacterium]
MQDSILKYTLIVIAAFVLFSARAMAQPTIIRVIDNSTSEPCMYTNVVASGLDGMHLDAGVTDEKGEIEISITRMANVCVSYVGYQTCTETVRPGETRTIRLEPDFINIDPVVVTGQYEPKPVDQSIYKIDVIDSRTLQERGANNLAEALSNETGIRLNVDPSTGTSVEMQGMGGENIKYLIDGVPIVGRVRGNIDLSQINMENVDHIEIVKGPMSVQYGTGAIAGVINIITKKNSYFNNIAKVNTYVDSKGNYNFGLYASMIKGHHTLALSGNRSLFQGVDIDLNVDDNDEDGHDRYMEFKPKRMYNADVDYAYKKGDFNLRIKSQYMNSLLKNYMNYIDKVVVAYDADYHTTRSTNSLIVSDKIGDVSYNIIGAYTYYGRETDNIKSDLHLLTKELTGVTSTVFNNIMTRGNFTYMPKDMEISFMTGWDVNYDNGHGDKIEDEAEIGNYALYLNSQFSLLEKLSFQPGVRFIYNTIYDAPISPSLNLQWSVLDNLGLRVSYARGFRAPSLKELYMDFKDSNHDISGNKGLLAETTHTYNTSLEYTVRSEKYRIKFEPSIFYKQGNDVITLKITNAASNSASYANIAQLRTLGGELNTSFRHQSGYTLGAGISRIGEAFDYLGNDDYSPMVYYHNYSFNSKYTIRKIRTVVMANIKYYGKTPSLVEIPEDEGGGYYHVYTDPYGDLEITVTKTLWKNKLNLVLGGKNLFNNIEGRITGYRDYGQRDFQETYYNPLNYGRIFFVKLNLKLIK